MFDVIVTYYDAETATLFYSNLTYDEAVELVDSLNNNPDFDGFANITVNRQTCL